MIKLEDIRYSIIVGQDVKIVENTGPYDLARFSSYVEYIPAIYNSYEVISISPDCSMNRLEIVIKEVI